MMNSCVFFLIVASFAALTLCHDHHHEYVDTAVVNSDGKSSDVSTEDIKLPSKNLNPFISIRRKRDICDGRTPTNQGLCRGYKPGAGHIRCIQFCQGNRCGGGYCANTKTCYCSRVPVHD